MTKRHKDLALHFLYGMGFAVLIGALMFLSIPKAHAQSPLNGFWVGGSGGIDWSHTSVRDNLNPADGVPPGPFNFSGRNWLAEASAGYDWAILPAGPGLIIVGLEADVGYMAKLASGIIPSSTFPYHQDATVGSGLYIDAAARLGVNVYQTFVYGKVGVITFGDGQSGQVTTKPGYSPHYITSYPGAIYGAGIEQRIGAGWSLKFEYEHFDFMHRDGSQKSLTDPPIGYVYTNRFNVGADAIKTGLSYKF